jgi:hypothetical protein
MLIPPLNRRTRAGAPARRAALAALLLAALAFAGCATTDDSDLPWNTPQSWEGTMILPGSATSSQ